MRKRFLVLVRYGVINPDAESFIDLRERLVEAENAEDALGKWSEQNGYQNAKMSQPFNFAVYEVRFEGPLLEGSGTLDEVYQAGHPDVL